MVSRHASHQYIVLVLAVCVLTFLAASAAAAATARSKAPAGLLPAELKGVDIKDYYNGTGARDAGVIQTVTGYVIVAREGMNRAYYAAPGDRLFEKDVVFTLKGSKCRFRLNGQDVVSMGENTRLGLKTTEENRQNQSKKSVFSMLRGKVMFYALRLFRYRNASMEVETPTSVSGVRGTKWGVEVAEAAGKPAASLPILVADNAPLGGFRHLAQAANPHSTTNVYTFEGSVFVNSIITGQTITLNAGQGVTADGRGLGKTFPIPPGTMNQFFNDTGTPGNMSLPPPAESGVLPPTLPRETTNIIQQQRDFQKEPPTQQMPQTYQIPPGR
jgi:hypothetical protein